MKKLKTYGLIGALIVCLNSGIVMAADTPEYSEFLGDYSQLQSRPDYQLIRTNRTGDGILG